MSTIRATFRASIPADHGEVHDAVWTVEERHPDMMTEATMTKLMYAALVGIRTLDPDATLELERRGR